MVPALCALAVVIQAALAFTSYRSFRRSNDLEVEWLGDLQALTQTQEIFSSVKDAQGAESAYMLTGDAGYLGPYGRAIAEIVVHNARLEGLVENDPEQGRQLRKVEELTTATTSEFARGIESRKTGLETALDEAKTGRSRELMFALRRNVQEMQAGEQSRLLTNRTRWLAAEKGLTGAVLVGSSFSVVVVALLALVVAQERSRRQLAMNRLAEDYQILELFLGIAGHELRNPVSFIRIAAGFLKSEANLSGELAETVERIDQSAARAIKLTQELGDATRTRLGAGIAIHPRETDLAKLGGMVVTNFSSSHRERQLTFSSCGNCVTFADPERIEQVLTNLVENAIAYGEAHSPIELHLDGTGSAIRIEVRNQGAPIPPDVLPRLFEAFSRGSSGRYREGLGLGLYIADQIVRAHNGAIQVRSDSDSGTVFSLLFPRKTAAE